MDFFDKCKVIGQLWVIYRDEAEENEAWSDFFRYNDVGLPAAHLIAQRYVVPVEESEIYFFINETWRMFCDYIDIDPNGEYKSINDAWDASPNLPIEVEEEIQEEIAESVEVKPVRKRATPKKD